MKIYYVAHPVGADPLERDRNIKRAQRWFLYLTRRYPDRAFLMPWLPYVLTLEETDENRKREIRDDLAALERCDGMVLVGGKLSRGMRAELERARQIGIPVETLLPLGKEPPAENS